MPLVPTPQHHPPPAPTAPPPLAPAPAGHWTPWFSVADILDDGAADLPILPGGYVFRISPAVGLVPGRAPTRLVHIGGMGPTGSIFQRVGNIIAAGMGPPGGPAPQGAAGNAFADRRDAARGATAWGITVRELDVSFVIAPQGFENFCVEVSTWVWYWNVWRAHFPAVQYPQFWGRNQWQYPALDSKARWTCPHGNAAAPPAHAWYVPPPTP